MDGTDKERFGDSLRSRGPDNDDAVDVVGLCRCVDAGGPDVG
jgi:hypothetical protein